VVQPRAGALNCLFIEVGCEPLEATARQWDRSVTLGYSIIASARASRARLMPNGPGGGF